MTDIISSITQIFGCFKDCCYQSCNYVVSYDVTIDSLTQEVNELKGKREDIERQVQAATRDGLDPMREVLKWLESAEDLENEAQKVRSNLSGMFKCFCSFPVNLCSSFQLRTRAEAARAKAAALKQQAAEFSGAVADNLDFTRFVEMPCPRTTGADEVLGELEGHAKDDGVSIIGIHGMGGVGKSALLRRFNNELLKKEKDLDIVIFLELTADYTVEQLQESLFSRLKLTWQEGATQTTRTNHIFRVLKKLKFVLLLDNLWEPVNYGDVGIPFPPPSPKCKIIFTTRLEEVRDQMGAEKSIKVECLAEEAAWDLFRSRARIDPDSTHPIILNYARKLSQKCGGSPAALITVAQAMASKRTIPEWKHAEKIMNDCPFQLPGMEQQVLLPLKLSYDHLPSYDRLPSDALRTCASYFSLVAEGCWLNKYYVRELWVGEGIIDEFGNLSDTADKASILLGILLAASLIQRIDNDYFKMHPMVRAMILWVARECGQKESKWLIQDRHGLVEAPEDEKWRVVERVSLGWNKIAVLPEAPPCPDLIFLHLRNNGPLKRIPNGFFGHMPCLRILDLRETSIEELPAGIGNLVLLQFLDLSHTKIRSLPRELEALVNLRYFVISSAARLRSIPDQVISHLQQLRWLNLYHSYSRWRIGSTDAGVRLEELESLKRLKILGLTVDTVDALAQLCGSQRLAASTHWLQMEGCRGMTRFNIPSASHLGENMRNMLQIRLHAMSDLEEVIIGGDTAAGDYALLGLEYLRLLSLPKARLVWKSRGLENLYELEIEDCKEIDQLMKMDDERMEDSETTITVFPRLSKIVLRQLPELKSVSDGHRVLAFPSLKTMEVRNCPRLKVLRMAAEKLQEIKCERSWWDELDWEDERTKSFQHLFVRL